MVVADLLDSTTRDWSLEAIRLHLPQYEVMIRHIVPSSLGMKDKLVWLPNNSGSYSTKSGYAISKLNATPAANREPIKWKQNIWNVKCLPKIKHFLWKVANQALPVGSNLAKRGLNSNILCKRCGAAENEVHVLFSCPFASRVWDLVPVSIKPVLHPTAEVQHLLQACKETVNLPPIGISTPLYPWLLGNLWVGRNKFIFEDKRATEAEIVLNAVREAKAWSNAQEKVTVTKLPVPQSAPPKMHRVSASKCHSDAAWMADTCDSGQGWIINNPLGSMVKQGETYRRFVVSPLMAEALAMNAAISDAAALGIKDLECYSDSKVLITLLTDRSPSVELQGILHDITVLSSAFEFISFFYVPRAFNVDADRLAKSALVNSQAYP